MEHHLYNKCINIKIWWPCILCFLKSMFQVKIYNGCIPDEFEYIIFTWWSRVQCNMKSSKGQLSLRQGATVEVLLQSHSVLGIVTICHILSCWSLTPCDSAKYLWQRGLTRGFETRPKPFLFILMREMCSVANVWRFECLTTSLGARARFADGNMH